MLILENPSQFKALKLHNTHCTVGVFDGVHMGHQKLIQHTVQSAKENNGTSIVMTFDKHPYNILNPSIHIPCLTLPAKKLSLIEELGVDVCILMNFSKSLASTSAEDWIKETLWGELCISAIYLSGDSFFGKDQKGDFNLLSHYGKQLGFKVIKVEPYRIEKAQVNSTNIRNFITAGDLETAHKFLGRPYSVFGAHVRGTGKGKQLGFPTINLDTYTQCMPPTGIYAVWVDKVIPAAANLGISPTFGITNKKPILEVHLLSDRQPLNPKNIEVTFLKKIRDEIKFPSVDKLTEQIAKDIEYIKNVFFSL